MLKQVEFNEDWYTRFISSSNEKDILVNEISNLIGGKKKSCLEIGLGTSPHFAKILGNKFDKYTIVENRKSDYELPDKVKLLNEDLETVQLTEKFDVIIASHVVYYFKDKKTAVEKIFSSLKEGGKVYFVVGGKSADYGPLKLAFAEMIGETYTFTYDILLKLLEGRRIREYTVPSVMNFSSYEDLFEILRLSFDMYPEEYERSKEEVIEYFKNNLQDGRFVIDQKIIEAEKGDNKERYVKGTFDLIEKSRMEKKKYMVKFMDKDFIIYPSVFSPKYFRSPGFSIDNVQIKKGDEILEIGCGAGIFSIVSVWKGANRVVATDINTAAVENAKENVSLFGMENKISVIESNVYDSLPKGQKFDLIFWNTPFLYLENEEVDYLERAVTDPGYKSIKRFVLEAKNYLKTKGRLVLEFSSDMGDFNKLKGFFDEAKMDFKLIKSKIVDYEGIIGKAELQLFEARHRRIGK